jgi:hypothetical protein
MLQHQFARTIASVESYWAGAGLTWGASAAKVHRGAAGGGRRLLEAIAFVCKPITPGPRGEVQASHTGEQ